jgi:hypothetical protein
MGQERLPPASSAQPRSPLAAGELPDSFAPPSPRLCSLPQMSGLLRDGPRLLYHDIAGMLRRGRLKEHDERFF